MPQPVYPSLIARMIAGSAIYGAPRFLLPCVPTVGANSWCQQQRHLRTVEDMARYVDTLQQACKVSFDAVNQ